MHFYFLKKSLLLYPWRWQQRTLKVCSFPELQSNFDLAFSRPQIWGEIGFDGNGVCTLPWERASSARFIIHMHKCRQVQLHQFAYKKVQSRFISRLLFATWSPCGWYPAEGKRVRWRRRRCLFSPSTRGRDAAARGERWQNSINIGGEKGGRSRGNNEMVKWKKRGGKIETRGKN